MFFAQGVPVRFGLAHHFVQGIALGDAEEAIATMLTPPVSCF
jgi:hypothetical protein